jgi:hypothetical protein
MDWIGHVLRLNFACADSKHQQLSNFVWQSSEKLKDGTYSLNRAFVAAYILAVIQESQYCAFKRLLVVAIFRDSRRRTVDKGPHFFFLRS